MDLIALRLNRALKQTTKIFQTVNLTIIIIQINIFKHDEVCVL